LPAPPELQRAEVLGVPLAIGTYEIVMDWMDAVIAAAGRVSVTAAAVNLVMSAREDERAAAALRATTLLVPDGQPLVWALRLLGHRAATRVYGPDLMAAYCARAARNGTPIYLYGGRDATAAAELRRRLEARFRGLPIAGAYVPPFRPLTAAEEGRVAADIGDSGAQVVWVGIGQPKQEIWMARMRPLLSAPVLVGVGAAFDFHAGLVRQAPRWMGRAGLEWAWRLAHEPRRLWRRYARYNPLFVAAFARQYAAARPGLRGSGREEGGEGLAGRGRGPAERSATKL
jgi:N-acetylglucosaminyldiphosphoundecaprenol N-acetyl-beta-D-mannosaminyltransferase